MVDDLRALPLPAGEQGEWVDRVAGRLGHPHRGPPALGGAAARRRGPPFVETAKGNDQVSEAVDGFAETNDMPSCATLNDV